MSKVFFLSGGRSIGCNKLTGNPGYFRVFGYLARRVRPTLALRETFLTKTQIEKSQLGACYKAWHLVGVFF
ncbi:hypothetical protein BJP36_02895 [Moorena producens JHB]|uniref:Uncharacterized protein n=1 Tax=Moorena producens (strain JHB) TaxID=1454205 RepID=A0A1D9FUE6_MOOP1|nr:hypothetical protein [Moorena producens]AOY79008.1 hypothetical protein BJP36_02895 [Moorena producens JHB]